MKGFSSHGEPKGVVEKCGYTGPRSPGELSEQCVCITEPLFIWRLYLVTAATLRRTVRESSVRYRQCDPLQHSCGSSTDFRVADSQEKQTVKMIC